MTISPEFLDELRARLPLGEVIGGKVKLRRQGREHVGLCPFHNEKTPSFTVADDKHFYHCFGCGAHGDVISFVTETEGLSFREAVEKLAARAGLTVPRSSPEEAEREEKRATLIEVTEIAAGWFESQLGATAGAGARDYLDGRGLTEASIKRFRVGFAPDRRTALKSAMAARGLTERQLVDAGLLIAPEDGGDSYDRFRNRVIFPISDRRGRVVAFGGRALGEARAKYLNSPETALFTKGRLLYNLHHAREASREAGSVIAVEGYMDVIALDQAGFANTVAPLGTALTEHQLREMWRLVPEPVLCFDGDAAGQRAGYRVLERALGHLKPGFSLRFAFLPEGEDPDSLIARQGREAFAQVFETASSLSDVLWQAEVQNATLDTPERRAGFQKRLNELMRQITDPKVRDYYRRDMASRLKRLFGSDDGAKGRRWRKDGFIGDPSVGVRPETRRKQLGAAPEGSPERRELLLLLAVINHPWLLERHTEQFVAVDLVSGELDKLRNEIIGFSAVQKDLDSETLNRHLQNQGYSAVIDALVRQGAFAVDRFALSESEREETERGWTHLLNRHGLAGLEAEIEAAETAFGEDDSEENWARLVAAKMALEAAVGNEVEL